MYTTHDVHTTTGQPQAPISSGAMKAPWSPRPVGRAALLRLAEAVSALAASTAGTALASAGPRTGHTPVDQRRC